MRQLIISQFGVDFGKGCVLLMFCGRKGGGEKGRKSEI
jgi:hypothetical protein